jgi:hypothetical protein
LGNFPFQVETNTTEHKLTVKLNGNIPAIEVAYRVPYKISALWGLISTALAQLCRQHVRDIDQMLPGFLDRLKADGYPVDLERPDELENYVITWMMHQHPPTNLKELGTVVEATQ